MKPILKLTFLREQIIVSPSKKLVFFVEKLHQHGLFVVTTESTLEVFCFDG